MNIKTPEFSLALGDQVLVNSEAGTSALVLHSFWGPLRMAGPSGFTKRITKRRGTITWYPLTYLDHKWESFPNWVP